MAKSDVSGPTAIIRELLNRNPEEGMSAKDIRKATESRFESKSVYKTLGRMKERGQIRRIAGRYYLLRHASPPGQASKPEGELSFKSAALDEELNRMKRDFDEYRRGFRDGWAAAINETSHRS